MNTSPGFFENGENFRKLFDNAHDLIYFAAPGGGLLYVNKAWTAVLGYTQQEVQGASLFSLVDEPVRPAFIEYRNRILAGSREGQKITTAFVAKGGKRVAVEGSVMAEFADGRPLYTTGIFRDVTTSAEAEARVKQQNEELRQRETDLQHLLFFAPDAVIVIDRGGAVRWWNPKAEAMFGWTAAEVIGATLADTIIPPQYREAHNRGMARYLTTGESRVLNQTIEITALKKSGEEFYVSLTISTTRQKGEVAFIAFLRDITAQKKAERELEKNRTALEASNRELEQFAHVASHDMKEPIRKISLFTDRVQTQYGSALPPDAQLYLEKIGKAAGRLHYMVDGILTYSSVTGRQEPFEELDPVRILKTVAEDLEVPVAQKDAAIDYGPLPAFDGVPFLIYQLFYNLIANSLKFSRPGVAPLIRIEALALPSFHSHNLPSVEKGPWVEISVADNGIGFNPEYAEKIFGTFTRLHAKDKYEGTGLGLALCKNIVERHGGTITAWGAEGEGARFTITLPQRQSGV